MRPLQLLGADDDGIVRLSRGNERCGRADAAGFLYHFGEVLSTSSRRSREALQGQEMVHLCAESPCSARGICCVHYTRSAVVHHDQEVDLAALHGGSVMSRCWRGLGICLQALARFGKRTRGRRHGRKRAPPVAPAGGSPPVSRARDPRFESEPEDACQRCADQVVYQLPTGAKVRAQRGCQGAAGPECPRHAQVYAARAPRRQSAKPGCWEAGEAACDGTSLCSKHGVPVPPDQPATSDALKARESTSTLPGAPLYNLTRSCSAPGEFTQMDSSPAQSLSRPETFRHDVDEVFGAPDARPPSSPSQSPPTTSGSPPTFGDTDSRSAIRVAAVEESRRPAFGPVGAVAAPGVDGPGVQRASRVERRSGGESTAAEASGDGGRPGWVAYLNDGADWDQGLDCYVAYAARVALDSEVSAQLAPSEICLTIEELGARVIAPRIFAQADVRNSGQALDESLRAHAPWICRWEPWPSGRREGEDARGRPASLLAISDILEGRKEVYMTHRCGRLVPMHAPVSGRPQSDESGSQARSHTTSPTPEDAPLHMLFRTGEGRAAGQTGQDLGRAGGGGAQPDPSKAGALVLSRSEVGRSFDHRPKDKAGHYLCWDHLSHGGCPRGKDCAWSHGDFHSSEALDWPVELQLVKRGGRKSGKKAQRCRS